MTIIRKIITKNIALMTLGLFLVSITGVVLSPPAFAESSSGSKYPALAIQCKSILAKSISTKACADGNLKIANDSAAKTCKSSADSGVSISDCTFTTAKNYLIEANTPKPKSADVFVARLKSITKKADDVVAQTAPKCGVESSCDLVKKYLNPAINLLTGLVGLAAVISLIIGGIQYSASSGNPQAVTSAKGRIRDTIILLLAYFFFYAFIQFLIPGGIF